MNSFPLKCRVTWRDEERSPVLWPRNVTPLIRTRFVFFRRNRNNKTSESGSHFPTPFLLHFGCYIKDSFQLNNLNLQSITRSCCSGRGHTLDGTTNVTRWRHSRTCALVHSHSRVWTSGSWPVLVSHTILTAHISADSRDIWVGVAWSQPSIS